MKYDHKVKSGGKYYSAGEEVPDIIEMEEQELPFTDNDTQFETMPAKRGRPRKTT